MEKTKLGLSVAVVGAIAYLACFYGGYVAAFLVVGYILIAENNEWLKKLSVKAFVLMVAFSVASSVVYLIPNAINCIDSLVGIFGGNFYVPVVSDLVSTIITWLDFIEKLLFLGLAFFALGNKTIAISAVDNFVEKHLGQKAE